MRTLQMFASVHASVFLLIPRDVAPLFRELVAPWFRDDAAPYFGAVGRVC